MFVVAGSLHIMSYFDIGAITSLFLRFLVIAGFSFLFYESTKIEEES